MDDKRLDEISKLVLGVATALFAWFLIQHAPQTPPHDAPLPIIIPQNSSKPRRPWRAEATIGGDTAPDGTPVQDDLPRELRMKNVGGRDGAGLCVFTSINHAAIWQDVEALKDFQKWMRTHRGGGYPAKVDAMIKQRCKEKGCPVPEYVQVEGKDLTLIDLALKTGRMACVTYGFSPSGRYGGQHISHMVNCVHADGKNYAILDNNYIEELEWLSRDEFQRAYASDGGWTFVFLSPAPPPVPRNKK